MKNDGDVHKYLLKIANQLNLQPHIVNGVEMALCGDIEIHKIQVKEEQNIFFALDMARVFPPAAPLYQDAPSSIFYRMLRPEFVKKFNLPLSSDALSNWQASDSNEKEMNNHVINATRYIEQSVTEFAYYLVTNDQISKKFIDVALERDKRPVFNAVPCSLQKVNVWKGSQLVCPPSQNQIHFERKFDTRVLCKNLVIMGVNL